METTREALKVEPRRVAYAPDTIPGKISDVIDRVKQTSDFYLKGGEKPEPKPKSPPKEKMVYYAPYTLRGKAEQVVEKAKGARDFYLKGADPLMPTVSEKK